jgi:hypothetical protein
MIFIFNYYNFIFPVFRVFKFKVIIFIIIVIITCSVFNSWIFICFEGSFYFFISKDYISVTTTCCNARLFAWTYKSPSIVLPLIWALSVLIVKLGVVNVYSAVIFLSSSCSYKAIFLFSVPSWSIVPSSTSVSSKVKSVRAAAI